MKERIQDIGPTLVGMVRLLFVGIVAIWGFVGPWQVLGNPDVDIATITRKPEQAVLTWIAFVVVCYGVVRRRSSKFAVLLSLVLGLNIVVGMFASTYYVEARDDRAKPAGDETACLSEHNITRVDALYFTLTTLTTTGYGDIAPVSGRCRAIVSAQMTTDVLLFAAVLVVGMNKLSRDKYQISHPLSESEPLDPHEP